MILDFRLSTSLRPICREENLMNQECKLRSLPRSKNSNPSTYRRKMALRCDSPENLDIPVFNCAFYICSQHVRSPYFLCETCIFAMGSELAALVTFVGCLMGACLRLPKCTLLMLYLTHLKMFQMMWVYCAFLCHFQMPCAMLCRAGPFFRKLYEIRRIQLHETQPFCLL